MPTVARARKNAKPAPTGGTHSYGDCIRCGRPDSCWRLASHACDTCWNSTHAEIVEDVHVDALAADRPESTGKIKAARAQLAQRGVRPEALEGVPMWAQLQLLDRSVETAEASVSGWTRPADDSVGWLQQLEDTRARVQLLVDRRGRGARHRHGVTITAATEDVAAAIVHCAGRAHRGRLQARVSVPRLMELTSLQRRTVQYALRTLQRAGFLRMLFLGTRVAGTRRGAPVSLSSVYELRVPLSVAQLLEQADRQRALAVEHSAERGGFELITVVPQQSITAACAPPSSAGLSTFDGGTSFPPAKNSQAVDKLAPMHTARTLWQYSRDVARDLQQRLPGLDRFSVAAVANLIGPWTSRGWTGFDIATKVTERPWPLVVKSATGILRTRLDALDAEVEPPSVAAVRLRDRRAHQARLQAEHEAARSASTVDPAAWYQAVAAELGWIRRVPRARGRSPLMRLRRVRDRVMRGRDALQQQGIREEEPCRG